MTPLDHLRSWLHGMWFRHVWHHLPSRRKRWDTTTSSEDYWSTLAVIARADDLDD